MKTQIEIAEQLNQYSKEINEVIRDEPDETTGQRQFDPIISEFYTDRNQPTVFTAHFDIMSPLSVDMHEPLSKDLVVARMLGACYQGSDLLEKHIKRLEEFLKSKEKENG